LDINKRRGSPKIQQFDKITQLNHSNEGMVIYVGHEAMMVNDRVNKVVASRRVSEYVKYVF